MISIQILGDKGGIGKDLLAEGVAHAALLRGQCPVLVELETSRRLGLLYEGVHSILLDALSPDKLYENPDLAFAPLDQASKIWRTSDLSITAFGANVTSAFLQWGRGENGAVLSNAVDIVAAVVLTMNRHALIRGLENLYDVGKVFPKARRVAILNDIHATFVEGDQHLARRLEEARGDGAPIETIHIRRCSAPIWGYAQNLGSLTDIAAFDSQKMIELGLPEGPVLRSKSLIATWIADSLIAPLSDLLPPEEKLKKGRVK